MLFIIFVSLSFRANAYRPSEGNVTAHLGPFIYKTDFKESKAPVSSPLLTGMGLIVNGDINDYSALEIGLFHMNKRFLREKDNKYLAEHTQVVHVTMGYKRWIARYVSTSLALYSAYPLGNTRVIYSDFEKADKMITSARDTTEYGLDFAIQAELWNGQKYDIIADARYSYSLTPRSREQADHYGLFIGLRQLVQEKNPDVKPDKKKYR